MSQETVVEKNGLFTPFNIVAGIIVVIGLFLTFLRFTGGIGAVTNLDYNTPWGIWIGFDLLSGVALAAGGYTTSAAVYIFGMKKYHAAVRPAILTGFLGYSMVVFALLYDVGQPWRLHYPLLVSPGTTSVLFEVGLCVGLYLMVLFLEFSNAPLEWLGIKKLARVISKLTILLTIFGVVLSTLHQSSLGSLFLAAPSKLHPLWYSSYMPLFFFVSSIAAGLSMVIFEGSISHRFYKHKMDEEHLNSADTIVIGFGKAAAMVLAGYFTIKLIGLALDNNWHYLNSTYGYVYLVEMIGFVLAPCIMYTIGFREKKTAVIKVAAFITVLGIVFNRLNVSVIGFNYQLPSEARYFPHWMEIGISVFIITLGLIAFKFIANRMPIFFEHPDFPDNH